MSRTTCNPSLLRRPRLDAPLHGIAAGDTAILGGLDASLATEAQPKQADRCGPCRIDAARTLARSWAPALPQLSVALANLGNVSRYRPKFTHHLINDTGPVPDPRLPEQSRAGIPRAVVSIRQPPPVRIVRQQYPHRLPHRAREMRHAGIHRDHEVHQIQQRGRVAEVRLIITEKRDAAHLAQHRRVLIADFLLKANPLGIVA